MTRDGPGRSLALSLATACAFVLCACSDGPSAGPPRAAPSAAIEPNQRNLFREEPWSFDGRGGLAISTPHYRLFTTQTDPVMVGRIPAFIESALAHYRTVVTGPEAPLPAPAGAPMATFLLRHRSEWERLTQQLLGEDAGPFLRISRGGYAWAGNAVVLDLGLHDTLTILAHEGWHQYTQRTFRQPLPAWLEEGIAALCEGRRPGLDHDPRHNPERRNQLARLAAAGRLRTLERLALLPGVPGESPTAANVASDTGSLPPLDYYAQAWGAAMFLRDGAHAESLRRCVADACAGAMAARIVESLGPARAEALVGRARGLAVLEAYFAPSPDHLRRIESDYLAYVNELVR